MVIGKDLNWRAGKRPSKIFHNCPLKKLWQSIVEILLGEASGPGPSPIVGLGVEKSAKVEEG